MTIKQTGGIFGRNPTFNSVDINGGNIDGVAIGTSTAATDLYVDNLRMANNAIYSTNTDGNIQFAPDGTGRVEAYESDIAIKNGGYAGTGTQYGLFWWSQGANPYVIGEITTDTDVSFGNGDILFKMRQDNSSGFTPTLNEVVRIHRLGGISFNGDTAAVNALDDYEEGTWTATVKGSTSDPSSALTATGNYTKIGDTVTAWVRIQNGNSTGASGNASVSGLPYTSNASVYAVNDVFCNQLNTASLLVQVDPSTTVIRLLQENGNAATWSSPGASMYASFQVTYKV